MNGEGVADFVAFVVAEHVFEVVVALLVEVDDASVAVGSEERQRVAWFDKGFHVPAARVQPMVVVAPGVDHAVHADGDVVDRAMKHLLAVDKELRLVNAVVVVGALHVVVGPDGEAYPAPDCMV